MNELLSPKLDIVFKKIFTENLDLLQHFVASMLSIPMQEITGIELTNPEMLPDEPDTKFSRLDLRLSLATRQIDIEIQVKKMLGYADRALFYWAKLFTSDLKSGEEYFSLKQAISIHLVDFILFEDRNEAHTVVVPMIQGTQRIFSDKMVLHFFELRKIGKNEDEKLSASMAQWLKFFNVKTTEDLAMFETDQVMYKASNVLRVMSDDDRMREAARMREKRLHDEASYLADAERTGEARGKAEERTKWIQKVIAKFKKGSMSMEEAAEFADMSEAEFEALCEKEQ